MSVTILQTPEQFQPSLSDGVFFTVSADTSTQPKFRYVYEVYVEDQKIFTGKSTPNPYGIGVIDLQQVLKNYCENTIISMWDTTPIYTHQTFPFSRQYENETINYYILVGEEHALTELGTVTGFTGIDLTVGNPQVPSSKLKVFSSTMGSNSNANLQDFNINPFVLSGNPANYERGLFLTNSPRNRDIRLEDYYTLSFTNYYMGASLLSEPYYVKYTFYDDQGSVITATTYENIVSNGGGPRTDCTQVYPPMVLINPWFQTDYNTLNVGAGPANIPNLPPNTAQYTVQLFGKYDGPIIPPYPVSPTPTPTPTVTPTVTPCNCRSYQVDNPSEESQVFVSWIDCDRNPQDIILNPGESAVFCACAGSVEAFGGVINDIGSCGPTPTPTPTPTSTPPCNCVEYGISWSGGTPATVYYTGCDGGSYGTLVYPGIGISLCACENSIVAELPVSVTVIGSCAPAPTPTPSPSPSQPPYCVCKLYLLENEYPYFNSYTYEDCNGDIQSGSLGAFQSTTICACEGSVDSVNGIIISEAGFC